MSIRIVSQAACAVCVLVLTNPVQAQRPDMRKRENPLVEEMTGPRAMDRQIIRNIAQIMNNEHFSKHPLDDEISKRAFNQFITSLDPMKLYFLQEDIDEFMRSETQLDEFAKVGNMEFAREVFLKFLNRVDTRLAAAKEYIDVEHDFDVDESMYIEPDVIDYASSTAEANDRMRRRIKYDFLLLEAEKARADRDKAAGRERTDAQKFLVRDPDEDPRERLHRRYRNLLRRWHQTDADELLERYVSSLTTSFDPHTSYMSPDSHENFKITMRLNLDGIGAQLTSEDGYTTLTSIVPGGAADKDGRLKPGDRIVEVGQGTEGAFVDVIEMKLDDVVRQIRGKAGTVVRLGVLPKDGGEKTTIEIVRAKITLEDSAARSEVVQYGNETDGDAFNVGYIYLPSFYMDMEAARGNKQGYRSTTRDVSRILSEFREKAVDVVVLDLTRNGGGSLTEAIRLTGLFIDRGPVVQVKNLYGDVEVYDDEVSGVAWSGPLVVTTSKESASASEILAGAIQDYRRGIIIGDPATHGKGTVQSLLDLGEALLGRPNMGMGALKITIQQFYLPDGRSTQRQGVMSDVVLPGLTASFDNSEADLDYALPNDSVPASGHLDYKMVSDGILATLREKSGERIQTSDEFDRLLRRIELFDTQKEAESVSIRRSDFLERIAEMDAQSEEAESILESQMPKKEVIRMNYKNREIFEIARDYVEEVRKLDLAQAG